MGEVDGWALYCFAKAPSSPMIFKFKKYFIIEK